MTSENLGEFLTGNRIETSPYAIYMQHNISCSALCRVSAVVLYLFPTCSYRPTVGKVLLHYNSAFELQKHCGDGVHPERSEYQKRQAQQVSLASVDENFEAS